MGEEGVENAWERGIDRRELIRKGAAAGLGLGALGSLVGAAGASAAGSVSSGAATAAAKLAGKVGAQPWTTSEVVANLMAAGTTEAARQVGLPSQVFSYEADDTKEVAQIDQMKLLGINAISTLILDNGITRQIARQCVQNNQYLSTWAQVGQWIVPSEPGIDYHYQCVANPPEGAYSTCIEMFKKLGGHGTFAHLTGAAGSATSLAKDRAVDRALKQFPGVKMVARQRGNYDRDTSRTVMERILTANNNKIDCVYCQNDDSAMGAMAALRDVGLLGKALVGGADGIPEMIDAIIAGTAFGTEGAVPFWGGGYTAIQALDAANGHKPNPGETLMQMDFIMVNNKASAQAYKKLVFGKNGGPKLFDYRKMSRVLHPDDWDPQWHVRTFQPSVFWTRNQGLPKPANYQLPQNYVKAVSNGGYARINATYHKHLKSFPLEEAARKSLLGKTLFQQLYGASA